VIGANAAKHRPERTCVACGAKKSQRDLLRVAAQGGSTPVVDKNGKAPGRGAYLCFDANCLDRSLKRKSFERALKLKSTLSPEVRAALEEVVKAGG
jgi:predicted RNA-binding protein YlxR (DUF448 family)